MPYMRHYQRRITDMAKKRIAILSIYYHNWNFGALLQSYALNQVLRAMGFNAEHIRFCYAQPAPKTAPLTKRIRTFLTRHRISAHLIERFFCLKDKDIKNRKSFYAFHDKDIHGSMCCYDAVTAKKLNENYDIFITGSDQVWNPEFWSDQLLRIFGLTFVNSDKKKISYAASIGSEKTAIGKEALYQEIMDSIDYISVREKAAKDFLQPLTNKKIQVVLDPTLLLSIAQWAEVAGERIISGKYIFSYFLEEKQPHNNQLIAIADAIKLPNYCVAKIQNLYTRTNLDSIITDAGPKEFLNYIQNAEYIITNSFHGLIFSIIFRKNFWVFNRYNEWEKDAANHRITDLLHILGLSDRLLQDDEYPKLEKIKQEIDYESVEERLDELRKKSMDWLRDALYC